MVLVLTLVLATGAEDDFYAAVALARDGKPAEAAAALRRVADGSDAIADDALAELGRLYEEQLGEPIKAVEAYDELRRRFPDSRLAVRAERRAAALREAMGPGQTSAAAVAAWQRILAGFGAVPRAESVARADRLLAEHPGFPGAAQVAYWIGTVLEQDGDVDGALVRWRGVAARWPDSEAAARAQRKIGDALLERGDFGGAEAAFRAVLARGDEQAAAARDGLSRVAGERWRARAGAGCWLLLGLGVVASVVEARRLAGGWRSAAAALARPPVEAVYLAPIAVLLVAAGFTENWAISHALLFICGGGLAVAWLSGALLEAARRAGRLTTRRAVVHALAAVLAVAAICYISVTRERLVDMLVETVRFGPDR